jgi:SAM-dependent methyltransferase
MIARLRRLMQDRAGREELYSRPEFWDGKARDYRDSAVSMFVNRNLNALLERAQFAFVDSVLGEPRGRHVLDVGAGTGRLSRHLARRGARVTSFDFAPAVVEIARALNEGLPIEAGVMSVFDLEAEGAYDDAAVLGCLSAACRDAAALADAARRLHRALRPGARVAMVEPFHRGFLHRVLDLPLDECLAVFEAAGFEVTHRAEMHFWPARFLLAPVEWPMWLTRPLHAAGEGVLRLAGPRSGLGDYKGVGLRRREGSR